MTERLIALADAANSICDNCHRGFGAGRVDRIWAHRPDAWLFICECEASGVRQIVEVELNGLGTKPTSEWRK